MAQFKPKDGQTVRLIGTAVDCKVKNNHCNGMYDIEFSDGVIREDVPLEEITLSIKDSISNKKKWILESMVKILS